MENIPNSIIKLLYDYVECLKSEEDFNSEFESLYNEYRQKSEDTAIELETIYKLFRIASSEKAEFDANYITYTEFKYNIMNFLQQCKNANLYSDIILHDYSKYL